jgi:hypothetical protein
MRVIQILSASVLAFACGTQQPSDDLTNSDQASSCVRVEGADLGKRVTVLVPSIDATMPVTVTSWSAAGDDPNAYIAFSLDLNATFNVSAGDEKFSGAGSTWRNPYGTAGVAGIDYVELCSANADEAQPPAVEDGGGDASGSGSGSGSDCDCGHC